MRDDEQYRALQEQAHLLTELEKHPGWAVFTDYVRTVLAAPIQRNLLRGTHDTLDGYKFDAGTLAGIERTLAAPDTVRAMLDGERTRRLERDEPLT